LLRLPRTAVALLAGVAVAVAACGGGSATAAPAGTSGAASTTAASLAPTANPNDPNSLLNELVTGGPDVKSFHIKIALTGTIKADALKASDASLAASITQDVTLDGTAVEGDVDIANQAAHLAVNVPGLEPLGGQPITADLILVGGKLYAKASLLGPKYTEMDLGSLSSLTSSLPVAVPTPGASALSGAMDQVAQLRKQLDDAGAKVTLVGVEQIGGSDAEHINITIPTDLINQQIAAESSAAPAMTIDSATLDVWVYKSDNRLAQLQLQGSSAQAGNLSLIVTVTNYDQPVSVSAPPADQVQATTAP